MGCPRLRTHYERRFFDVTFSWLTHGIRLIHEFAILKRYRGSPCNWRTGRVIVGSLFISNEFNVLRNIQYGIWYNVYMTKCRLLIIASAQTYLICQTAWPAKQCWITSVRHNKMATTACVTMTRTDLFTVTASSWKKSWIRRIIPHDWCMHVYVRGRLHVYNGAHSMCAPHSMCARACKIRVRLD